MLQSLIRTYLNNFGHKVELQISPSRTLTGLTLVNLRLCDASLEGIPTLLKEFSLFKEQNDGYCGTLIHRSAVNNEQFLRQTKGHGVLWLSHRALGMEKAA